MTPVQPALPPAATNPSRTGEPVTAWMRLEGSGPGLSLGMSRPASWLREREGRQTSQRLTHAGGPTFVGTFPRFSELPTESPGGLADGNSDHKIDSIHTVEEDNITPPPHYRPNGPQQVITSDTARQGPRGTRVLVVLVCGLAAVCVAFALVYFFSYI